MNANTGGVGDAGGGGGGGASSGGGGASGSGGSSGSGDSSSASTAAVLQNLAIEMASITLSYSLLFFGVRYLMREMDPQRQAKQQGDEHKRKLMQKLAENGREGFAMDDYEAIIANDLIYPEDIDVTFEMIGGLDEVKTEIFDIVALPLQRPDLFVGRSKLLSPPKGILLFGPPGTGKTMMAKAIARESGAAFINLQMSTTMNKWFGESQKLIRATFSLAWKLAPCVVFIDEIDSFMRERSSDDPSAQANMKSEFLALWDGMLTQNAPHGGGYGVIVVGATNRPWDIDPAILRRMPRTFKLDLPSMEQRLQILKIYLQDEDLDSSLRGGDMVKLAQLLNGYSGSDIKELCQAAAMLPFREFARECRANGNLQPETKRLRKLTIRDFLNAMKDVRATGQAAYEYHDEAAAKQQGGGPFGGGFGGGGGGAAAGVSADQFQLMLRAFMEYAVQSAHANAHANGHANGHGGHVSRPGVPSSSSSSSSPPPSSSSSSSSSPNMARPATTDAGTSNLNGNGSHVEAGGGEEEFHDAEFD